MIIGKTEYDRVNARNVELAKQLSTINDILMESEIKKIPSVYVVDKIKEVIRRHNKITSKLEFIVKFTILIIQNIKKKYNSTLKIE